MTHFQNKDGRLNIPYSLRVGTQSQKLLSNFHKTVAADVKREGVSITTAPCPSCGSTHINLVRMPQGCTHHAARRCGKCDRFLSWESKPENKRRQQKRRTTIATLLESKELTDWEREFLEGLRGKRSLSPRQQEVLSRIEARLGGDR